MTGFKINSDGSLTPVPGSPFSISSAVQAETSLPGILIVATRASITVFTVDREAGFIQQTGSIKASGVQTLRADVSANAIVATSQQVTVAYRIANGKLQPLPMEVEASLTVPRQDSSVATLDASGQFMYVVDQAKSEIQAFRVDHGEPQPLTPSAYPASHGANSLALVTAP
jgi:6-phosphogluconolactonase (cycloisomerase 2 family)